MKTVVFLTWIGIAAMAGVATAPSVLAEPQVVDVGNTHCPVSGDKVSGKHFVTHEGKRYGLCCPHCVKDFKKDPAKHIATLEKSPSATQEHGGHEHAGQSH